MLWFNLIHGLNFSFIFFFKLIMIHYHTQNIGIKDKIEVQHWHVWELNSRQKWHYDTLYYAPTRKMEVLEVRQIYKAPL